MTTPSVTGNGIAVSASTNVLQAGPFMVTSGGAVVVFAYGSVASVTDTAHNLYKQVGIYPGANLSVWLASTIAGAGSLVVTVNFVGVNPCAMGAIGLYPVGSTALDAVGSGTSGIGSPAGDNVATTVAGDIGLACVYITQLTTLSGSGGSTILNQAQQMSAEFTFGFGFLDLSAPGTYAPLLAFSGGTYSWNALSVAIQPSGSTPPPALVAGASANPSFGVAPLTVAFSGSATGGTSPYSFAWAFGDGTTGVGQNPSHTYATPGGYRAVVTVTDSASNVASATVQVTVSATPVTSGVCAVLYVAVNATPAKAALAPAAVLPLAANANGTINSCAAPIKPSTS